MARDCGNNAAVSHKDALILPRLCRSLALAALALAATAGCGPSTLKPRPLTAPPESPSHKVSKGFVVTTAPEGIVVGADEKRHAVKPKVTDDFAGPPTSNDWWSSLIWQFDAKEPYSWEMFPHPMALKARGDGLAVGYPSKADIKGRQYFFPYDRDLVVGLEGLASPDTRVAGYSDWAVTADWRSGGNRLRATFGHGMPFVYCEREGTALHGGPPRPAFGVVCRNGRRSPVAVNLEMTCGARTPDAPHSPPPSAHPTRTTSRS